MSAYLDPVTAFVVVVGGGFLVLSIAVLIVGATIASAVREAIARRSPR